VRFDLHSALLAESVAAGVSSLPAKPAVAVTAGVLVVADDDGVRFSSFNYDRATTRGVKADVGEPGRVVVSGRLLSTVAGLLPKNRGVEMETDGWELAVRSGRTVFRLPLMIAEDYPELPALSDEHWVGGLDAQLFADAARQVGAFASVELAALNMAVQDGDLVLCASNSYTVARRHIPFCDGGDGPTVINVPAPDVLAVLKAVAGTGVGSVDVLFDGNMLGLRTESTTVVTRVLAEEFPNIERILAAPEYECCATVSTAELSAMVKRAGAVADDEFATVAVSVANDALSVVTLRSQAGSTADEIEAEHHGPPRRLALNARKFHATLAAIEDPQVTLGFQVGKHLLKLHPGGPDVDGEHIAVPDTATVAAIMGIRE
tara:strand:- start:2129 stop:3256 length:1128 start_codon:yes stop_codon:yes gene_type:complete